MPVFDVKSSMGGGKMLRIEAKNREKSNKFVFSRTNACIYEKKVVILQRI